MQDNAIVGQDWKEPKVCSPFSRIYYIVDGEGILTVNGQRIVLKKGSVWLVPAGMTFGYFCESSMEQLFFSSECTLQRWNRFIVWGPAAV